MTKAQNKKIQTEQDEMNNMLLEEINDLSLEIKRMKGILNKIQERKDMLLQEAVDRKITETADYALCMKPVGKRVVDMAAVWSMFSRADVESVTKISLKGLAEIATEEEIRACTMQEVKETWYVAAKRGPWDRVHEETVQ